MIIQNGYISAKSKQAGGIDPATGFPVKSAGVAYMPAIPCQYYANSYNNLGRTANNERFTVATYTILIEQQPAPFTAEQIRLQDMNKQLVGNFSVISIENIDAVCEVKILV